MSEVQLITLTEADLGRVRMLCGHSPSYKQGYEAKLEWMHARIREGMHYSVLKVNGRTAGMIEYIPGEYAWRGVEAHGYLFIHCFWVVGQNRKHGFGRQLLQACLDEARGTRGVAVVVSKTHWLPTPKIFMRNGFELADHAPPSFDLLVKRFEPDAPLPRFRRNEQPIPPGLTLYTSNQCPYTQNVTAILMRTGEQLNIPVNIVHMDNYQAAQEAPCLYGTLGYFYNGELLTYRPSGTKKLIELIEPKLVGMSG
jgi:GNAT superfamily N-acetyltransferase